ncbi:hypothetical protein POPTR_016G115650v4 [Populus trichocarpa]|uniref:Uncharacterized protein n=1 Tax=Populus trichocarpa TaxID=3694 RepID=A0ACC0RTM4_POPTR|nr:hypothetical protein POPTR_016G115650v4 [Populus trichocarpa]
MSKHLKVKIVRHTLQLEESPNRCGLSYHYPNVIPNKFKEYQTEKVTIKAKEWVLLKLFMTGVPPRKTAGFLHRRSHSRISIRSSFVAQRAPYLSTSKIIRFHHFLDKLLFVLNSTDASTSKKLKLKKIVAGSQTFVGS